MSEPTQTRKHRAPLITVECAGGCGKTQSVRQSRIVPADHYFCSACDPPTTPRPAGYICTWYHNAAGSFRGVSTRPGTPDELAGVARARQILYRGLAQEGLLPRSADMERPS